MVHPERAAAQAVVAPQPDPCPGAPTPAGFEDFFRSAWPLLIRTALAYGASRAEAEDAVAEALYYMLTKWPITGNPIAYARKATRSYFFRSRTRGDRRIAQRLIDRGHVPHHEGDEDMGLAGIEADEWAAEILGQLTLAQRQVLELIAEGHNYQEIAELIGKSDGVVRRRVSDARSRLRAILTPDGEYKQSLPNQASASREEAR